MTSRFFMPCPAYDEAKDDECGEELEIEATRAEPATMWYPGSPAEFEIVFCKCGHKEVVEKGKYSDDVWEFIRDQERSAAEYAAEAAYDRWKDEHCGEAQYGRYMGLPLRGGRGSSEEDY